MSAYAVPEAAVNKALSKAGFADNSRFSSPTFPAMGRRLALALVIGACGLPGISAAATWMTVDQDSFNYASQTPENSTFNTWFWREDSAASHRFNVSDVDGCTAEKPCVALTASAYAVNTAYTNAEMYNNSCSKGASDSKMAAVDKAAEAVGASAEKAGKAQQTEAATSADASQQLATLGLSVWGKALQRHVTTLCDQPYPYQSAKSPLTPKGITSSWSHNAPVHLESNPLSMTLYDVEADWKATRDIVFNNPYRADINDSLLLTTEIRATTQNQGGSRGWGFWNTTMDPGMMQLAWFMEYSMPQSDTKDGQSNRTLLMQTIGRTEDGKSLRYCSTVLDSKEFSIYDWHTYKIELRYDGVQYLVDGRKVADHRQINLEKPMAFHNWVDNRNYLQKNDSEPANFPLTQAKENYIRQFSVESTPAATLPAPEGEALGSCTTLSEGVILSDLLKMLLKDAQF
ncbi:hypothetical protein ACKC9G_09320 [Pokkaliibacter sp. CJK22405]|uniref:hypothetical protein n=1 Tax=Pokkaliibacter sp. CJK22405 TaxID=3384615 RepID=UPI003984F3AD